jgi:hypothetical protein
MGLFQGNLSVVWGCAVTGITYTGSGSLQQSSESYSIEADTSEVKNSLGEIIGIYHFNYRTKLSLSVIPAGSSVNVVIPTIGQKVTIAATNDTKMAGDYIVSSISQDRKQDGIVEFKIDLTKYDNLTIA